MYEDKTLTCKACGKQFVFSANEQAFFAEKGFQQEPTRCKECRAKQRQEKASRTTIITCSNCGKKETVTFQVAYPDHLLCDDCFNLLRTQQTNNQALPNSA